MLTLREAQHHRNTCPQYILQQRGLPTTVEKRIWNHVGLLLLHHRNVIQTNHRCKEAGPIAVLHTDVGGGPTGEATTLDQMGTTLHLVRVTPDRMRTLQRTGSHHVPFLQHPDWFNKSVLENHLRKAAVAARHPQPTDGEILEAYNLFWSTHKQPLPQSPPKENQAHHRPPKQVGYVPETTVPVVLLLAPNGLKVTLRHGKAQGSLWMLPPPRARKFCPPPLPQDLLTGIPSTCWRCGPHALVTPWPIVPLLVRHHHTPTAHAPPEQHPGLYTHFKPAPADMLAAVTWQPNTPAGWCIHRGTFSTKRPALTYPVLAKQSSTTPEAPAYPTKHRCSRKVPETQTIDWTTYHPKRVYQLQYIPNYLIQGHERNCECIQMNAAATEIIHQGMGVYAVPRIRPATTTSSTTTAGGARVHSYQPSSPCRLPRPDDQNNIIFADASGTMGLNLAAGGAALELRPDETGQLRQHHLFGTTIFEASLHGELKTIAIILDADTDVSEAPRDQPHHVWVIIDAAVDFQILRRLAKQPLHKATDSSLGKQALHLWVALRNLPGHIVLNSIKQESHRYNLGNRHIDLHARNQLAEHIPIPGRAPTTRPHANTPPAPTKDEQSGVGERPTPDSPHTGKRRPPRAPSCRPHSAQSQLAGARAVALVTGPRAHTPRPTASG